MTKNTTRMGGSDPASDAAAVARAVYPGLTAATRPQAVVLVDERNWPAALAASVARERPAEARRCSTANGDALPAVSREGARSAAPAGRGRARRRAGDPDRHRRRRARRACARAVAASAASPAAAAAAIERILLGPSAAARRAR